MPVQHFDLSCISQREIFEPVALKNMPGSTVKYMTKDGWKILDSPFNPFEEAESILNEFVKNSGPAMLIGTGSGYLVDALLKRGIKDLLIITASTVFAGKHIRRLRQQSSVKATVVTISHVTEKLFALIKKFIGLNPEPYIILHPREIHIFKKAYNKVLIFSHSLIKSNPQKSSWPPKQILMPAEGQIFEPEIIRSLTNRGAQVSTIKTAINKSISHLAALESIHSHNTDLIISTNNKGSDKNGLILEAAFQAQIPWATWFLDNPRFIVSDSEDAADKNGIYFCWDYAGCDECRMLGLRNVYPLPLATDLNNFSPGKGDPYLTGRIVYVGSPSFGNEHKYFAGLFRNSQARLIVDYFEKIVLEKRKLPSAEALSSGFDDLKLQNAFNAEERKRLPAFILYRTNLKYRIAALTKLADLKPIVFGDGWEGLLPETIEIRPFVNYYNDLATIYRSDAVHLSLTHLQMYHYPNQRVFDAGACGSIVLGEHLSGWAELFGTKYDDLVFENLDELLDKAHNLLCSPHQRAQQGEQLKLDIIRQHTIAHRLEHMLKIISDNHVRGIT